MARPRSEENKPLTDTEIQIMNILWEIGDGTVHDVLEELSKALKKKYAYTTASTLLRVLEKKGAVTSKKAGRGHTYKPAIKKENYQTKATKHLVQNVFSGEPAALIKNLLGNSKLTLQELKEVQKILVGRSKK